MSIFSSSEIAAAMRAMNPWWEGGRPPAVSGLRRMAFRTAREWVDREGEPTVLLLKGPRWVGKTSLLYRLIEDLLEGGRPPRSILYLSFTTSLFDFSALEQLYDLYRTEIGPEGGAAASGSDDQAAGDAGAGVVLFLDEAHRAANWAASIAAWAAEHPGARLVATVSPAALTAGAVEALAGATTVPIDPLSFAEFLAMRRLPPRKRKPPRSLSRFYGLDAKAWADLVVGWSDLELFLADYLARGGFPRTIEEAELTRAHRALREDVLEDTLTRDAALHSGARNPAEFKRLFTYIAYRAGEIWNAASLAEELVITGSTVLDYLDHLERSELVYAATNFREEQGEAVRIRRKFFPADPSLRNALLFRGERVTERVGEREKAVATAVMAHLFRSARDRGERVYFWKDGTHEVDFVLQDGKGEPVPVVVRCRQGVGKHDVRGLVRFMEQYKAPRGVVVTWGREEHGPLAIQSDLFARPNVVRIPAWLFLYLYGPREAEALSLAAGS